MAVLYSTGWVFQFAAAFGIFQDETRKALRKRYNQKVPIISMFFGIVIRMFYREHEPAHFHVEHQGQHAKFDLDGEMIVGSIHSKTALRLIREWASLHRRELEADWENMKRGLPMERIEPLQ